MTANDLSKQMKESGSNTGVCPHCGECPTCGKRVLPYPIYPMYPTWPNYYYYYQPPYFVGDHT